MLAHLKTVQTSKSDSSVVFTIFLISSEHWALFNEHWALCNSNGFPFNLLLTAIIFLFSFSFQSSFISIYHSPKCFSFFLTLTHIFNFLLYRLFTKLSIVTRCVFDTSAAQAFQVICNFSDSNWFAQLFSGPTHFCPIGPFIQSNNFEWTSICCLCFSFVYLPILMA